MNIKYMRALLIFDLPTLNAYERKEYRKFRKFLIRQGYIMIQFSVYVKAFNGQIKTSEEVKKFADVIPKDGNIRIIKVTEHQ
jgi:CRISPR-associated protein Cas2